MTLHEIWQASHLQRSRNLRDQLRHCKICPVATKQGGSMDRMTKMKRRCRMNRKTYAAKAAETSQQVCCSVIAVSECPGLCPCLLKNWPCCKLRKRTRRTPTTIACFSGATSADIKRPAALHQNIVVPTKLISTIRSLYICDECIARVPCDSSHRTAYRRTIGAQSR